VRKVSELSGTAVCEAPVERSSVPLAAAFQVFSTQLVMPGMVGFGIGSGVPKLQPVLVQSGSALSTAGVVDVGPMLQLAPVQLSETGLGERGGVGPWERGGAPAPMLSPPQVRLLMTVFEPSRVSPQLPVAALRTKSRNAPPTDIIVVVVVELVAVVVELVLVVGLVVVVVELVAVVVELVLVVGLVVLVVELVAVVVELVLVVGLVVLVVELVAVVVELVLVVGLVVVVVTPPLPVFTNLMH